MVSASTIFSAALLTALLRAESLLCRCALPAQCFNEISSSNGNCTKCIPIGLICIPSLSTVSLWGIIAAIRGMEAADRVNRTIPAKFFPAKSSTNEANNAVDPRTLFSSGNKK